MLRYTVIVTRTLILTTNVTVRATNEDVAYDLMKARIDQGEFGVIGWDVEQCQVEIDDWQEDSDEIYITMVEEEP
jgi:hypothetical protein